jgi:hypothetical protein
LRGDQLDFDAWRKAQAVGAEEWDEADRGTPEPAVM